MIAALTNHDESSVIAVPFCLAVASKESRSPCDNVMVPGIKPGPLSKSHHLPIGHFSEAMRSFACVEHPHLRQRPVPAMPAASHRSQALQVSMRRASVSGSVAVKPDRANLAIEEPRLAAI